MPLHALLLEPHNLIFLWQACSLIPGHVIAGSISLVSLKNALQWPLPPSSMAIFTLQIPFNRFYILITNPEAPCNTDLAPIGQLPLDA